MLSQHLAVALYLTDIRMELIFSANSWQKRKLAYFLKGQTILLEAEQ